MEPQLRNGHGDKETEEQEGIMEYRKNGQPESLEKRLEQVNKLYMFLYEFFTISN